MHRRGVSREHRRLVARRAGGCCDYCCNQAAFSSDSFAVEHITPVSAGGGDDPENLAMSGQGCNNRKYASTVASDPITREPVPLYHPRRDRWSDHFAWSSDYTQIVGLSATGRATIARLDLNRAGLVNLRRLLVAAGRHPPLPPED